MKKFLSIVALLIVVISTQAQNPFFQVVNYRGAFAPAPATPWTDGWTNWDPQHVEYPATTITVTGNITANTTWTSGNTYLISGLVYVKPGATLTIEPGTIVRGDASTPNSSLVITKGGKINAVGTSSRPIVFTSSKDTGVRAKGDWGGIILLGRASVNKTGGVGNIEGIATSGDTEYGGGTTPDDNDNSGNLKYVRIEFGGYIFATDQEINGLTLGAVGRNTVIDFVQCSFINDDAFEWFGGTVNCSHLVAYRCLDDNFDTDNGFSGSVQFCLGVRDPQISDQSASSTSEGFESDNDAAGSANTPQTSAVFSNVTDISGFRGTVINPYDATFKFRTGARIRRNSGIKILNSIMMDAPAGVYIDGAACRTNLKTGVAVFSNNIVAGFIEALDSRTSTTASIRNAIRDSLFSASIFKNDSLVSTSGILTTPYDFYNPDYRPASNSLALSNVDFNNAAFNGRKIVVTSSSFIKQVTYRGAFAPAPSVMWTDGWTNWDPKHTNYPSPTVTVTGTITSNTTWTSNNTYLISGLVYVAANVTLTIQPGTIIRGDATVANSSLIVTKNAKLNAIGTVDSPIVFTSSKDTANRSIGDWGGVILLGRAAYNGVGGVGNIEGIAVTTNTEFGGGANPYNDDNSGTLKYVRIEYGGYIFATDKEINGLTFGAVGRGTTIDYVQCSFVNDDAFEWFGGTVNCSHLVAYRCLDDNFDTDNGFSGSVQFCLGVRDPQISDQSASSTSEGFESDNDASGSSNTPQTSALFSNVTDISGFRGTVTNPYASTFKFRTGARIRRNSGLKIFNSILMDAPAGVYIDGSACRTNLKSGITKFKNNLVAGNIEALDSRTSTDTLVRKNMRDSLFSGLIFKNDSAKSTSGILITPYDFYNPDYRPSISGLGVQNAAFTDSAFTGLIAPCDDVFAPGTMTGVSNISGCTGNQTYSIPAISNASSYYWTVPTGVTIVSGQGTRTITVSFVSTLATTWTGIISVVGKNDCGNSSVAATKTLIKTTLGTPGSIVAPTGFTTSICSIVAKDTSLTYSITAVAGATNYAWTVPSYTSIVSGQGTNSIKLKFLSGYPTTTAGDTLRLVVSSSCSTAVEKKLAIKAVLPATPAAPTQTVIKALDCGARIYRYSAPALVAPATGYIWQMPSGGTLSSSAVLDSGVLITNDTANARYIRIKFTNDTAAATLDSIKVAYISACGVTAYKGLKLAITKLTASAAPASITATAVVTNVCGGRVYRYAAPTIPTSTTTPKITGYEWMLPTGNTIATSATLDSGVLITNGADSARYIKVKFADNRAAGTNDSIRVRYLYACGTSAWKAAKLTLTALSTPAAPSAITITALPITTCGNPRYSYSVPTTPNATTSAGAATGYDWSIIGSLGATIDSGLYTNKIYVTFSTTAAHGLGDSVKCRYTSDCGLGAIKTVALTNALSSTNPPAIPASITVSVVQDSCGARIYRYAAPVLPVGTSSNASPDGYEWFMPTGSAVAASGSLDSGSLSGSAARYIRIKYTRNTAAVIGDSIRVRYTSVCGVGSKKALKLTNTNLVCIGGKSFESKGNLITSESSKLFPNPNNGVFTLQVNTGTLENSKVLIQVSDMLGKVVYQSNSICNNGLLNTQVNTSNLSNGIYNVRYTIGSTTKTIKMIVQK